MTCVSSSPSMGQARPTSPWISSPGSPGRTPRPSACVEAVEVSASQLAGPWPSLAVGETDRLDAEMRCAAEQALAERRPRLERPGVTVESSILEGRPASAIVHEAKAMDAELVVVGSRGHGTIESMLLGSVSAEVVDHAPAPVLVARGGRIDRVVLAWDGSACAARAATLVRGWPIFCRSDVRVVSVADIGTPWWTGFPEPGSAELVPMLRESAMAVRDECGRRARSMKDRLVAAGLRAEAEPREGDPATQILAGRERGRRGPDRHGDARPDRAGATDARERRSQRAPARELLGPDRP